MPVDEAAFNSHAPLAGVQRQLLGAHFLLLRRLLRKSARIDYEGYQPHNLIERRIVLSLHRIESARVSELAGHLGNDVAQVSRALTTMRRQGLVTRNRQRDPYNLTDSGRRLGDLIDHVALRRELELTAGLDPQQMFELAGLLISLLEKATSILADELASAREGGKDAGSDALAVPTSIEIHSRAQPIILNIATTISRSATAAYKRLTGASNYEWRVLVNIAERPLLRFTDIVNHVDSDKAQVSRTLDALVAAELLERRKAGPGEPVRFAMTARGHRLHDIMREDALRRNALLEADMSTTQRRRLQTYLDLLVANAAAMRAGEEE